MFIQYLQVQNNAAIVLSHWHGRRRIFQLCAKTGEGKREGGELGPSQGGQKHPWTPTLIYALMMRLWKVLTLITDFLAWSVNSALESSWLGTSNVLLFVDAWLRQRKNTYILKKKKKKDIKQNISRELRWRSGESIRLLPRWPGFVPQTWRHLWTMHTLGAFSGFPSSTKLTC